MKTLPLPTFIPPLLLLATTLCGKYILKVKDYQYQSYVLRRIVYARIVQKSLKNPGNNIPHKISTSNNQRIKEEYSDDIVLENLVLYKNHGIVVLDLLLIAFVNKHCNFRPRPRGVMLFDSKNFKFM